MPKFYTPNFGITSPAAANASGFPNRFPGACHICGEAIAKGTGTCVKIAGQWKVQCADAAACAFATAQPAQPDIPVAPLPAPAPAPITPSAAVSVASESRPDFADAIDALVADLVARGDVIYDAAADAYVPQRCQRWRFA